jgi:hypothetical protein
MESSIVLGRTVKTCSFISPDRKKPIGVRSDHEETVQAGLNFQFTFLDMSRSTTDGHLPHIVLQLRRAETTTSASQLEIHLQAAPAEQFSERQDTAEQSAFG